MCFAARADMVIYNDSLQNSWQDWGWATHNYANTSPPVHSGADSISVTPGGYQALYIAHAGFNPSPNTHLRFWINGGPSGGQQLNVVGHAGGATQGSVNLPTLSTNTWQEFTIALADLGLAGRSDVDGIWFNNPTPNSQPTFYLDDISLIIGPIVTLTSPSNGAAFTAPASINLAASVTANGHTINKIQFFNGTNMLNEDLSTPYAYTWTNVSVGIYSVFARAFYDTGDTVDSASANLVVATNSPAAITVDAQLNRHAISPLIYGVAFATASQITDLNTPLNRSGGNAETRNNWQLNAHNHAADWYFESLDDYGSGDPKASIPGASSDDFITASKTGGADPAMTIPMIGWTTKLGTGRAHLSSFSVAKYGAQQATDPSWSDAGNGVLASSGAYITNDPTDANFQTNSTFAAAWVQHLTNQWGLSTNGGVRYYLMDNEHSIWYSTHRDIHPVGPTMTEIRDKFFDYAGKVKSIDPNALVLGPEEWGWNGYLYSGLDQQYMNTTHDYNPAHFPDRSTNGGWDYMPWLLNQFYQRATNTNQRLLDYFTLHCYPQTSGQFGDDVSVSMQLTRNSSTRQFWDTNYVDPTWVNSIIKLIPRMKGWVASYYPGTKIGVTEYNWGAEGHINGATAQADIYGIFGREGLDLATRWTTPNTGTPTYLAMKMYRNYDGSNSGFGDTSVNATGPNPDNVSTFAAVRSSDGALTLIVINKQLFANAVLTANIANFAANGTGQVWQLNAGGAITRLSDLAFSGGTFNRTLQPQSITLFILPPVATAGPASNPSPANGAINVVVNTSLSWTAGTNASAHQVYFGANSNAVYSATTNAPEFRGTLANTSFGPGTLATSGRFFWRVDELAGLNVTPGSVWTFATIVAPSNPLRATGSVTNGNTFVVSFLSQVGQTYRVERTDSLTPTSWVTVVDNLAATGQLIQVTDPNILLQAQRYYRVVILAP
jgi:hypothetical protein